MFCFWNGHEIAEAAGSTYFVDSEWDRIQQHAIAYLNVDSPGMKLATTFVANRSLNWRRSTARSRTRVLGEAGRPSNLSRIGDQSFLGIGVPSLAGRYNHPPELVEKWHGATLGWWNHTTKEDLDKVDLELLNKEAKLWVAYILALATSPVLPHRFTARAQDVRDKLDAVIAGGEDPVDLARLLPLADRLITLSAWLDSQADAVSAAWAAPGAGASAPEVLEEKTQLINRALMRLSRFVTSIVATATGRYAQDSYGLSTLREPVPMLAPLNDYRALAADSLERKLLRTQLLRSRNQISDALQWAAAEVEHVQMHVARMG